MNRTITHCYDPLTVSASPVNHLGTVSELLPCCWRRFSPYGMRISVRPGPRTRVVHRVLPRRTRRPMLES
jgi:hypothetical protein